MWKGEACEQRAFEIEKEVLGMLRSILGLEAGQGWPTRGGGGWKGLRTLGVGGSSTGLRGLHLACGQSRAEEGC